MHSFLASEGCLNHTYIFAWRTPGVMFMIKVWYFEMKAVLQHNACQQIHNIKFTVEDLKKRFDLGECLC